MAQLGAAPQDAADSLVTEALPGTLVSRERAEYRRLPPDKPDLRDQLLGDWALQASGEREFPIADRGSRHVGPCIALPMVIAPTPGIATADAVPGRPVLMATGIPDGLGTPIPL
jgi:hypothetical protein